MAVTKATKMKEWVSLTLRNPGEAIDRIATVIDVKSDKMFVKPPTYSTVKLESVMSHLASLNGSQEEAYAAEAKAVEEKIRQSIDDLASDAPIARIHSADFALARLCYIAVRTLKPKVVLETGVAYGVTSAFILEALEANGAGTLESIDLPPLGPDVDSFIGILIPKSVRHRWTLHRGVAKRLLPKVLAKMDPIDMFVHDSLHTYKNILFELQKVTPHLASPAAVIADDIDENPAFLEWSRTSQPDYSAVVREEKKTVFLVSLSSRMKVLVVHNYYQYPGGEDGVFIDESSLLADRGHDVVRFETHNDRIAEMGTVRRLFAGAGTVWSRESYKAVREVIREERPDVMHVHNTLPLLSPSIYHAARKEGVGVVQTLHNYRMLCPGALFYRDGKICEDCLGKSVPLPGVKHKCYRGSTSASGAVAAMLVAHRWIGTWSKTVNYYISMTHFGKSKFVDGGIPEDKIVVKPHFVNADLEIGHGRGGYALFVGRLTKEKGVDVLLDAWQKQNTDLNLKMVGDGPLRPDVELACSKSDTIEYLGQRPAHEVHSLMSEATVVIVPSVWYETFGRVITEAFAVGTPVLVSRMGAIEELVTDARTGRHFNPGDSDDLAKQITWFVDNPDETATMRQTAFDEYHTKYSADSNYKQLIDIYQRAIDEASGVGN